MKSYVALVDRQFNAGVQVIRIGNDPEFSLSAYYVEKGIVHHTTCVETPEQNQRVESIDLFLVRLELFYFSLICLSSFGAC